MNLKDRIMKLAELEDVNKSELILDEIDFFLREHKNHGLYDIVLAYDPINSNLVSSISLKCSASDLRLDQHWKCPHQNSDTLPDLCRSFIYLRNKTSEIIIQRNKREGLIDYVGRELS